MNYETNYEHIIDVINEYRKRNHISTRKVAEMVGMHQTQIVLILNKKTRPRIDTLCKIAWSLGYRITIERIGE